MSLTKIIISLYLIHVASQMFAALGGDVLADEQVPDVNPSHSGQPAFSVWKN